MLPGLTEGNAAVLTFLALVVALVIGAVLIAIADPDTRASAHYFTASPADTFTNAFSAIWHAYKALFEGAIFNPTSAGNGTLVGIFGPLSETLTTAAPLILAGLSVGLAFRAGLFNIGAQGMMIMGVIVAAFIGFHWDLPVGLHLIFAVAGGLAGRRDLGWAGRLAQGQDRRARGHHDDHAQLRRAELPRILVVGQGFPAPAVRSGDLQRRRLERALPSTCSGRRCGSTSTSCVALAAAGLVWWVLERSTIGFQLRAVGANQNAARTAGMNVARTYVVAMMLAGALAGLAGTAQILGTNPAVTGDIDAGIGFDGITVALLGRARPGGTVLAGLLFGALRAGGVQMQSSTGVPVDLVQILQAR